MALAGLDRARRRITYRRRWRRICVRRKSSDYGALVRFAAALESGFLQPWEPTWPADDLSRGAYRRRLDGLPEATWIWAWAIPSLVFRKRGPRASRAGSPCPISAAASPRWARSAIGSGEPSCAPGPHPGRGPRCQRLWPWPSGPASPGGRLPARERFLARICWFESGVSDWRAAPRLI